MVSFRNQCHILSLLLKTFKPRCEPYRACGLVLTGLEGHGFLFSFSGCASVTLATFCFPNTSSFLFPLPVMLFSASSHACSFSSSQAQLTCPFRGETFPDHQIQSHPSIHFPFFCFISFLSEMCSSFIVVSVLVTEGAP